MYISRQKAPMPGSKTGLKIGASHGPLLEERLLKNDFSSHGSFLLCLIISIVISHHGMCTHLIHGNSMIVPKNRVNFTNGSLRKILVNHLFTRIK